MFCSFLHIRCFVCSTQFQYKCNLRRATCNNYVIVLTFWKNIHVTFILISTKTRIFKSQSKFATYWNACCRILSNDSITWIKVFEKRSENLKSVLTTKTNFFSSIILYLIEKLWTIVYFHCSTRGMWKGERFYILIQSYQLLSLSNGTLVAEWKLTLNNT